MRTRFLFPNKLVYQAMDETIPDEIEGLSLTCKDLYGLASLYLEQHRANKRRYSTINPLAESSIVPFHLMEEILSTPRVVLYPKTAIIGPRGLNRTAMDTLLSQTYTFQAFRNKLIQEGHPWLRKQSAETGEWEELDSMLGHGESI